MKGTPLKLVGQRFGKLTVQSEHAERSKRGKTQWVCQCDCGTTVIAVGTLLKEGRKKSCGCSRWSKKSTEKDKVLALPSNGVGKSLTRHGQSKSRIYAVWSSMLRRCYSPQNKWYQSYGGRGIKVCERWHIFEYFREDIGERPSGQSMDRTDNEGGYTCGKCDECSENGWTLNVRWATPKQQSDNRRGNRWVDVNGKKVTLKEAARITGIPYWTIRRRFDKGLPAESILRKR